MPHLGELVSVAFLSHRWQNILILLSCIRHAIANLCESNHLLWSTLGSKIIAPHWLSLYSQIKFWDRFHSLIQFLVYKSGFDLMRSGFIWKYFRCKLIFLRERNSKQFCKLYTIWKKQHWLKDLRWDPGVNNDLLNWSFKLGNQYVKKLCVRHESV